MKFGKKIIQASKLSPAQWQQEWLNYKSLKKMINAIVDEQKAESKASVRGGEATRCTNAEEMGELVRQQSYITPRHNRACLLHSCYAPNDY